MKLDDIKKIEGIFNKSMLDILIKFSFIILLIIGCDRILGPFWSIMLWALILAISLYPLHQKLSVKFGEKDGKAAIVIVLSMILAIGVPVVTLGGFLSQETIEIKEQVLEGTLNVPAPLVALEKIPGPGKKVYDIWSLAHSDFPAFVEKVKPHVSDIAVKIFDKSKNIISGLFMFIASMIVAGIIMAYGKSGNQAMLKIYTRFVGGSGASYQVLTVQTVRSVAVGVLGVAFIQAIILGTGFVFAGIPAPGLLALITLVLGIIQVPAAIIVLPVVAYLWLGGDGSTTTNLIWTIYLVVGGLADNVLKPILLGRGVDAPMPVILLGALGGMFSAGIIGMFIGAVGLSLGYELFMAWVNNQANDSDPKEATE
jgi:predicted PurR-regulated permease PerM